MSIKYMCAVWEDTELKGNERLVMLAIADSWGDAPFPSIDTISRKANLSTEETIEIIASLGAKGCLKNEVQP